MFLELFLIDLCPPVPLSKRVSVSDGNTSGKLGTSWEKQYRGMYILKYLCFYQKNGSENC